MMNNEPFLKRMVTLIITSSPYWLICSPKKSGFGVGSANNVFIPQKMRLWFGVSPWGMDGW